MNNNFSQSLKSAFLVLLLGNMATNFAFSQNSNHVQLQNAGSLSFVPSWFSSDGLSVLHLYQENGVNIYDNDVVLQNNIPIEEQEETYLARKYRTRTVNGVTMTSFTLMEDKTSTYEKYCIEEQNTSFSNLTKEEKIQLIILYEYDYYGFKPDHKTINNGNVCFFNGNYSPWEVFFAYDFFYKDYPKKGITLTPEGKVYSFIATYDFNYSEWSELKDEYDTLKGKGILSCQYINMDGNLPATSPFYITQTLFNNNSEFEYIRPLYILTDNDYVSGDQVGYGSEHPVTIQNEDGFNYKVLGIKGISVVATNGNVIKNIEFEDIYNEIGQFSIIGDNIFKSGADLCILQLGNNIYLTFDTKGKDKDYNTVIYKHFYKIGPTANSIEEVKSRMLMNIFPASPKANETINININSDEDTEILFTTMDGKLCNRQKIPAGQNQSQIVGGVPGGAYIVSLKNKNGINNSKKIIVR